MNSNPEIKQCEQDFNQIHLTSTEEITWTARNLNSWLFVSSVSLDSPPFVFQNATWCLRLYKNFTSLWDSSFFGLMIVRLSSRVPHHKLRYLLMPRCSNEGVSCQTADFDEDHKEAGNMKFISQGEMVNSSMHTRDSIEVICVISCYGSQGVDVVSQTEHSIQDMKDVGPLGQNLKDLLLNGQDHDVVLKVKDKELRAHQNILRARSPVLESMLSHDMTEKNNGAIDIPDCDPSAFEQFLIYLYSGQVDVLDTGSMLSLYYIADKYDVGHLKEKCREFIKISLSSSNITDVVQTALNHSDADLLRWSTDYFVEEVDEILPTVEWLSFLKRNAVQANELFIKATKNMIGWRPKKMAKKT